MIGAMPAVAVRHERRKKKHKEKIIRPKKLLLKPYQGEQNDEAPGGAMSPASAHPSRAGSPTHRAQNGTQI